MPSSRGYPLLVCLSLVMAGALHGCAGGMGGARDFPPQWVPPKENLASDDATWRLRPTAAQEASGASSSPKAASEAEQGEPRHSVCDDLAERESAQAMQERRMAQIQALPIGQQECAVARLHMDLDLRGLNYARRCSYQALMPALEEALGRSKAQVEQACRGGNVPA